MKDFLSTFYPEAAFGGFSRFDGTVAFYARVNELVTPSSVVLDLGCGRGAWAEDPIRVRRELRNMKGKCAHVIGMDVDRSASVNPGLNEFRHPSATVWQAGDNSVDVCICDNVLEHVEEPSAFLGQTARVLRPGGYLAIRTPNVLSYFGLVSAFLPSGARRKLATHDGNPEDVFPTKYRCNTRRRLRRALAEQGFDAYIYNYEAEPPYLSFSKIAYGIGVLHQRLAPRPIRIGLVAFAQKPAWGIAS